MQDSQNLENQYFDSEDLETSEITENEEFLLKNNPLLSGFKIVVNKMEDKKTFENTDGILIHKQFHYERERATKLYINPRNRKWINDMSNNSKSLLFWIMLKLPSNKDYLKIDGKKYMKENEINSVNTFKTAIKELQANLIICASAVKDVYFINPRLIFSGNRIKHYPKRMIVYESEPKNKKE